MEKDIQVQAPREKVKRDSDGYYLFDTPCSFYVQDEEGEPVGGEHYKRIQISEDGEVEVFRNGDKK